MSGNVLIICITIVICGVLLAFCHYNEHKEDLSTDRFEYLVQQIEMVKKDHKILSQDFNAFEAASVEESKQIAAGFEERDEKIFNHEKRIQILVKEVFSDDELISAFDVVLSGNCSP